MVNRERGLSQTEHVARWEHTFGSKVLYITEHFIACGVGIVGRTALMLDVLQPVCTGRGWCGWWPMRQSRLGSLSGRSRGSMVVVPMTKAVEHVLHILLDLGDLVVYVLSDDGGCEGE